MDARVCSWRPASLSQTCRYMRGVSGVSIGEQAQVRRAPDIFHGRRDRTLRQLEDENRRLKQVAELTLDAARAADAAQVAEDGPLR